jgi:hypothetical protein
MTSAQAGLRRHEDYTHSPFTLGSNTNTLLMEKGYCPVYWAAIAITKSDNFHDRESSLTAFLTPTSDVTLLSDILHASSPPQSLPDQS